MGSTAESVRIVIFGTEYSIKGDVDIETTKKVAQFVNDKIAEICQATSSRDNLKIAVLSALNIAGELMELKAKHADEKERNEQVENRISSLIHEIDTVLKD